jgi:phage-related protein
LSRIYRSYIINQLRADLKSIQWLGDSLERLRKFPAEARREIGYQLGLLQQGLEPSDWRPMPIVGSGTVEIRVHAVVESRVFYVAKFEDAIYVLHVFVKKTRKASSLDVELGKRRYQDLLKRRG